MYNNVYKLKCYESYHIYAGLNLNEGTMCFQVDTEQMESRSNHLFFCLFVFCFQRPAECVSFYVVLKKHLLVKD